MVPSQPGINSQNIKGNDMISCTRRFEFDAAHRVLGHKGNCRHLHGHRYSVEVTISVNELDALGMVIDFADLKELVGGWINKYLDHNILLNTDDLVLPHLIHEERRPYLMGCNPTAENIAREIYLA